MLRCVRASRGICARGLLAACAAFLFAFALSSAPAVAASDAVPGQLVVGFQREVSPSTQRNVIERAGGRLVRRLAHIRGAVVRARRHGLVLSLLRRRLAGTEGVRYAEPDYYLRQLAIPDDPLYPQQYALGAAAAGSIGAPTAWNQQTSCSKVAVLDTGTQYTHPDLAGNVWHNPGEIAGNDVDDDHNGYIDDYYGVNLVKGRGSGLDDNGHGTHVSGIIAGRGNNATGISGLCWSAEIVPVKFMDSEGRGSSSDAATGLDYTIASGAKIVNGSFGSSSASTALADEVDYAESQGVLCVFAAGNEGANNDRAATPTYPANFPNDNIITVAATTSTGALASFSNYGVTTVDLGAPGDSILSTYLGSTYRVLSGTSMASPMVAAAAAMIREQNPALTYSQIRTAILEHTQPDAVLDGKVVHPGILNVAAALASIT